jgi:hypothetical protein
LIQFSNLFNKSVFNLKKKEKVIIDNKEYSFKELNKKLAEYSIKPGGHFKPSGPNLIYKKNNDASLTNGRHNNKIAIIIPYRDRLSNLKVFLLNMHPFLAEQNIEYAIYVVESAPGTIFNRGLLKNVGFIESLKDTNDLWDCFFFHDVDVIAENRENIYQCNNSSPIHYAVSVSLYSYKYNLIYFY